MLQRIVDDVGLNADRGKRKVLIGCSHNESMTRFDSGIGDGIVGQIHDGMIRLSEYTCGCDEEKALFREN